MAGSIAPSGSNEWYRRQMQLPEVGAAGQQRLGAATALVVGAGALGGPVATWLVRAGVGRVIVADGDRVETSNLHRQLLFGPADVGAPKADVAARVLAAINPQVRVESFPHFLSVLHSGPVADADIVLDCTDRFSSRFAIHDVAIRERRNLVSGAVMGRAGQLQFFAFETARSPCLRCLYPEQPEDGCTGSCAVDGVIGAAAGIVASWQALTAIRILLGAPVIAPSTTYTLDLVTMKTHSMAWDANPQCAWCSEAGQADGPSGDGVSAGARQVPRAEDRAAEDRALRDRAAEERTTEATAGGAAPATSGEAPATCGEAPATSGEAPATSAPTSVVYIDIREPSLRQPVDTELLPQARPIEAAQLAREMDRLGREVAYVVVCERGVTSITVRDAMRNAGFPYVSHLPGGFAALRDWDAPL